MSEKTCRECHGVVLTDGGVSQYVRTTKVFLCPLHSLTEELVEVLSGVDLRPAIADLKNLLGRCGLDQSMTDAALYGLHARQDHLDDLLARVRAKEKRT